MLARNEIEKDALARAAEMEERRQQAAWAAATATRNWVIVHIAGQKVMRTRDMLQRYGYDSWYPLISKAYGIPRKRLSHAQRRSNLVFKEFRLEPLARNYLLVHIDIVNDHWHGPFREAGAYGLACDGDVPVQATDKVIARLRELENEEGGIPGDTLIERLLAVGDDVEMLSGPFRSFPAKVEEVDDEGRLKLLVHIFGRGTPVMAEVGDVKKVLRPE